MPISQISFISAQPLGGIKQLDPKVREGLSSIYFYILSLSFKVRMCLV